MQQRRRRGEEFGVGDVGSDEAPVDDVERSGGDVDAGRAGELFEQQPGHADRGDGGERRREQPAGAAQTELAHRERAAVQHRDHERADEHPREREEQADAQVAARDLVDAEMERHHRGDGDAAQAVEARLTNEARSVAIVELGEGGQPGLTSSPSSP